MPFDSDYWFWSSSLLDIGAFMVFRQPMIYAVHPAAVSAHVRDEFFRPADGAAFHDCPVIVCLPT